ncbi:unnamed protein product [Ilex paraguariensis]|uniref:Pentatricopeptide repeat-containing protein n=1 Tax=Ilex paraguariensis TaxID=185542 RepID=A0ABC8RUX4_9AQUA
MHLHRPHLFTKSLSTSTTKSTKPTLRWRNHLKQTLLVSQISSILLQRHNWGPLLKTLNLSSKLTPSLFLQVLHKTQANPQISLSFFNWAKANLGFQPDLRTHCKLTQILYGSGLSKSAIPILDSLIQDHPPTQIVDSLSQSCKGTDFHSLVLSSLLKCYCHKNWYLQGLEIFRETKDYGHVLSIQSCNELLNVLQQEDEVKLAWCFYSSMLRNGLLGNRYTWSIIARILCKDGKFERIVRILDMGIDGSVMYDLLIERYSRSGKFEAAFNQLDEMCNKKLNPGFHVYSSILDGACKYKEDELIEKVMDSMMEKGYLPKLPFPGYDSIIQKLSDLGKIDAADMFFRLACDEKVELHDTSYGCMLRALSKEGRVKDAIGMYHLMLGRKIVSKNSCYTAFVNVLCKEDPSEEVSKLLRDMIEKGFTPCASELSKYIASQCDKRRWREAEDLLNAILDKGLLPDWICSRPLVEHYCSSRRIDSAIGLHKKVVKLEGTMDLTTYNILLNGLVKGRRLEEALGVFDYMRRKNLLSSESFSIVISGLCHEKELRKAMKLHDEMLKVGLKPDAKRYKRLISGFK